MRNLMLTAGVSLIILFLTATAFGQSTTLVSVNGTGTATSNGISLGQVTSADGRFVAFQSSATDLVATSDTNNADDIFVRDLQTNTTKLVSVNSSGAATGNKQSSAPLISADGRFVAFLSLATDLVNTADANNGNDVFVRDLQTNTTKLVSINSSGNGAINAASGSAVLSADGRFVVFASNANDVVVLTDNNTTDDIFSRDLQTDTTELVSITPVNTAGNGFSSSPVISADGRFVAFQSAATNLVNITDNNNTDDVFVRDLQARSTSLVSVNNAGTATGNSQSQSPAISADGRAVAFLGYATDLVTSADNNNDSDVFVRDLPANATSLASTNSAGTAAGNSASGPPIINADGRYVSFVSFATDLVAITDNNNNTDVFVRDRQTRTTKLISGNRFGTATGNANSGAMAMSADGQFVAFSSFATDLVTATDNNSNIDIFVRDVQANTTKLASINTSGAATGNNFSVASVLSADGRFVSFVSLATDLITTPEGNTNRDVFVFGPLRPPTTSVQFSSSSVTVGEGAGSATVTVTRNGDTSVASTVDFATSDGTAVQSQDYTVTSGTLSFAAGESGKSFSILIVDDAFSESDEVINLSLSNATGAFIGTPISATIKIVDNDSAGSSSPAAKRFFANLSGANSIGKGIGLVLLNQAETAGSVGLSFRNLTSAETDAHIHSGNLGSSGPVVFTLPTVNPVINFAINPTTQQVADLKAGLHYQDVHTVNFGVGEIAGQLLWNPTLEENFFVRQQYLDFLSREPDTGGFNFWVNQVGSCAADTDCFHQRTISTSNAFFFEPEFQQTAGFIFRAYRAAYGNTQPFPNPDNANATESNKLINYSTFVSDRARVVGGADLPAAQLSFANLFISRPEFTARYAGGLTGPQFVDAVLARIQADDGVDLTAQRQALIDQFNNAGGGNAGRAQVLYRLADDNQQNPINNQAFINAEYNRQFALTLYFGYLRRNPDIGGFLFWQGQINSAPVRDVPKQNALVCSFITAGEYQLRFGLKVPRSNLECQ